MKPLVLLVHGYNVADPEHSIGQLRSVFEGAGFDCALYEYGHTGLAQVAIANAGFARGLLSAIRLAGRPVFVVAHSNGCALVHRAAHEQWLDWQDKRTRTPMAFHYAAYLSPALDRDAPAAPGMERIIVCHTRHDSTVRWASWIPFALWGDMGARGAKPEAHPYRNNDCSVLVKGHSDWTTTDGKRAVLYSVAQSFRAIAIAHGLL